MTITALLPTEIVDMLILRTHLKNMLGRESMIIKAFGSDSSDVYICNLTTLEIKNGVPDLYLNFQALTVPFIASPIQCGGKNRIINT